MSLLGRGLDLATGATFTALNYITGGAFGGVIQATGKVPGSSHPGGVKTIFDKPQAADKVDIALSRVTDRGAPHVPQPSSPAAPSPNVPTTYFDPALGFGGSMALPVLPFVGGTPGISGGVSSASMPWWGVLLQTGLEAYTAYKSSGQQQPLPPAILSQGQYLSPPKSNASDTSLWDMIWPGGGLVQGDPWTGYLTPKKKYRRMNYTNVRAARRAIRRIKGTRKLLQSIEKQLPRRTASGRCATTTTRKRTCR